MPRRSRNAAPSSPGVSRRDFLRVCSIAAASVGLPAWAAEKMAVAAHRAKPSVVWLHFQECTGGTESLLRASHPDVASLLLDLVAVDYHETLFAAAGHQIEGALEEAKARGGYVLVVEGSIPLEHDGGYCTIGGKTAVEILRECAGPAAAVIAIGSCASWGGIASTGPNPTGATGAPEVLKQLGISKPTVTLPGCPPNPYNLLGVVLQFATFGTLPKLDDRGRPAFAYARVIHEDCPRRPHFDRGEFAERFGDGGHRKGWCLYKLGCKGPQTFANCALLGFCDVPGAWPIGVGHPCVGCTEQGLLFGRATVPGHADSIPIHENLPVPPMDYPAVQTDHRVVSNSILAVAAGGAVIGALAGAGAVIASRLGRGEEPAGPGDAEPGSRGEE